MRPRALFRLVVVVLSAATLLAGAQAASAGPIIPGAVVSTCVLVASNCVKVSVDVQENGSGTVTSSPAGIDCTVTAGVESGACTYNFTFPFSQPDITIELTATPAVGSLACLKYCSTSSDFTSQPVSATWSGLTNGMTLNESNFHFALSKHTLLVTKTGAGTGKVVSSPAGVDCGSTCSKAFDYGTKVTLTATPDAGAVFKTWTGACNGQGATCTLTVTQATATNAVFELPSTDTGGTGGATTAGGTTGGGTTGGGATGGGGQGADTAADVDVVGAKGGKSRIGKRIVSLELNLDENVSAVLTLVRGGKTLATKNVAKVKEGNRVLILVVPRSVAKGKATLQFELTDAAGNTQAGKRGVRIPAN